MKIIDLSHTINNDISVFNPEEKPDISSASTHKTRGYAQKKISMYSHNSTHVDAPFHILPEGKTLDQLPPEHFLGPALVADCRNCDGEIGVDVLEKYSSQLRKSDFILLFTGWYNRWKTPGYQRGFPVLSTAAAEWLLQFNLKGVGIDTLSPDPYESLGLPVHKILLGNNMIIIENLTNLKDLPEEFLFSCLPLKIEDADGSPVRAVGIALG